MGGLFKTPKIPEQEQKIVDAAPPVQDASVEIETDDFDDTGKKKQKTSKGELKIPLAPAVNTGLKV